MDAVRTAAASETKEADPPREYLASFGRRRQKYLCGLRQRWSGKLSDKAAKEIPLNQICEKKAVKKETPWLQQQNNDAESFP